MNLMGDLENSKSLIIDSEENGISLHGKALDLGCGTGRVAAGLLVNYGNFDKIVLVDREKKYTLQAEKYVKECAAKLSKSIEVESMVADINDVSQFRGRLECKLNHTK